MEEVYTYGAAINIFSLFLGIYVLAIIFAITMYVLQSIGLYSIADRRGLRHAWMAWVPIGNVWIIGAIADHCRTVTRGEKQNRRLAILILAAAVYVLAIMAVASMFSSIFRLAVQAGGGVQLEEEEIISQVMGGYFIGLGLVLLSNLTSIALLVVQYVCLYEVYDSCDPGNKVLYILLSILLGLAPVFLFACRKKDLGMYPRMLPQYAACGQPAWQQPVYQPPVPQAPAEPAPEAHETV